MRAQSLEKYLQRLDEVIARISASLACDEAPPSVAELAGVAHLSPFHFMRIYRALAGEPLGETIQRLRLAKAVHLLTETTAPVTDVAVSVGFETPQAFATAFRKVYGVTPTEARQQKAAARLTPELNRSLAPAAVSVNVIELKPFRAVAVRHQGDFRVLNVAYGRLFDWVAGQGALGNVAGIWGIPHHDRRDTPAQDFVFDCCLSITRPLAVAGEFCLLTLGGGQFAGGEHRGSYERLDDTLDEMLVALLASDRWVVREEPILHEFLNDPDCTPENELVTRLYVPVRPAHGGDHDRP